jgi:hypothetical protein
MVDIKNGKARRVMNSGLGNDVRATLRMVIDEEVGVERRSTSCMGTERLAKGGAIHDDKHGEE